ncbi:sulfotransferase [Gilvimarinus sp. DA14]|uniref:sulfotransferase n=1 Tax=Gilvimarinus sp. DA14 TaxID=2956798 RepID=UPI0020B851EE|nr:sulfotransferase [Gilvimarinus sp. DA14]UTF59562.1 sulfotransferase [Gilvimarinus sp. DA14]
MSKSTDLKTLQQELQQALSLINDYGAERGDKSPAPQEFSRFDNTQSLLERCASVVNNEKNDVKPTLRIIHHFACSGGSLISKCLAAQSNVFLLSEIHPTTRHGNDWSKAVYSPRDIVTQAYYGAIPQAEKLAEEIFVDSIIKTEKHTRNLGGTLVIRAHSHADYCMKTPPPNLDTVTRLLQPHFDIKQLVTVRNPIDSFLSLRVNGWVHFHPNTFDEYCQRLLRFLNAFDKPQIAYYEDFVLEPELQLRKYAELLSISVTPEAIDYMDIMNVSGDSGRSGSLIEPRKRKPLNESYKQEILESESFKELCQYYKVQPLSE